MSARPSKRMAQQHLLGQSGPGMTREKRGPVGEECQIQTRREAHALRGGQSRHAGPAYRWSRNTNSV